MFHRDELVNLYVTGSDGIGWRAGGPGCFDLIIPAYNEARTVVALLGGVAGAPCLAGQIIIVDDGSSDATASLVAQWAGAASPDSSIIVLRHEVNRGKSRAIRTGLAVAQGRFTIVQDADLEYDPREYGKLLEPLLAGRADLVLGSRYLNARHADAGLFFRMGVGVLNLAVRMVYGVRLTDEATCYKAIATETLRRMDLQCERFEFCPEVIAKACRMGLRIVEVPISYHPRSAREGKKIRLRDGIAALRTLWRWRRWRPTAVAAAAAAAAAPVVVDAPLAGHVPATALV